MNSFTEAFQEACSYYRFLKEENKRKSMTPKEYGMALQKKRRKKRK